MELEDDLPGFWVHGDGPTDPLTSGLLAERAARIRRAITSRSNWATRTENTEDRAETVWGVEA